MNEDFDALLFPNGNAMFFDEEGEQIPELQKMGWPGVHIYLERYPDAKVAFGLWDKGIFREMDEKAIDSVAEPEEIAFENGSTIDTTGMVSSKLEAEGARIYIDGEEVEGEIKDLELEEPSIEEDIKFTGKVSEPEVLEEIRKGDRTEFSVGFKPKETEEERDQ